MSNGEFTFESVTERFAEATAALDTLHQASRRSRGNSTASSRDVRHHHRSFDAAATR